MSTLTNYALSPVMDQDVGKRAPVLLPFLMRLQVAFNVRRQRKALLELDERMLSDIGLSKADVYREATRTFMDVPGNLNRFNAL